MVDHRVSQGIAETNEASHTLISQRFAEQILDGPVPQVVESHIRTLKIRSHCRVESWLSGSAEKIGDIADCAAGVPAILHWEAGCRHFLVTGSERGRQ